ncbi:MAG: hypothetical protein H6Q89_186 [Myxococcaceae bacterium]|nr:hypothetical protein [Myxococcaceae bacterium]
MVPAMTRLALAVTAVALGGCRMDEGPPGDENMGLYQFRADPVSIACGLPDIPGGGFEFSGTFSRFRDGGAVFLTLNGIARDAGFDGQIVTSRHSAARTFKLPDGGACAPCEMRVVESLSVALVSKSQSSAVGDRCPANPLDGGLPAADAGVTLPGSTETGFDAVRACGELTEQIVGSGTCDPLCACLLQYRLVGERK